MWLPLHLHGVAAFRSALDDKLDLAMRVHDALSADPRLEVPWRPELSTMAFRLSDDAATLRLMDRVNDEQRVRLSSTRIDGRAYVRVSVLNHRTDAARIDEAIDAIRRHTPS
jgi:aromatic-L-amino-acid decarboxylase